ncbi:MAG: hypothetical protein U0V64_12095 [Cyclobacteriaceae bacterium]
MKKLLFTAAVLAATVIAGVAQEFKVVTVVESIVPGGLGRSRIIDGKQPVDYKAFTTERTDGSKSEQSDVKRSEIKIDRFDETKLLNFYSLAGINFQNIASNDEVITSKLNEMAKEGWSLVFVTSGVESDAGKQDGEGIFITRFVFKK